MNRKQLLDFHNDICNEAREIMKKKNHDYAGQGGEQPFANFERTEAMGVCSTEQGFLVRVIDKVSRLSTFVQAGELKVDNESYQDAVLDIINYMVLFGAFVQNKNDKLVDDITATSETGTYIGSVANPSVLNRPDIGSAPVGPGPDWTSTDSDDNHFCVHRHPTFPSDMGQDC